MTNDDTDDAVNATERILEAAREVFASEGLDASLGEIARVAGVGVGSIYRRFGNKDDLIQELADQRFSALVERMSASLGADDAWVAFSTEFRQSVADYTTDRGFRELVLGAVTGSLGWARGSEPDRLRASMARWSTEIEEVIDRLLKRAQHEGTLRADVSGSVILGLSIALQSISGLADHGDHEKAITIVLDGLRRR
ncbi:TetR/AcrR family transcriptional regulator [Microbacterium sp. 2FI]|uniref:TetR/AcrR family transcriptional regulator n=1 Tax=Microbacterium sp. 2FI TaxID=2502193 RepID=UPI0010F79CDB|nr:TetR/AcrR family transcriptional regulator [Microbacterium sp. 2FI]